MTEIAFLVKWYFLFHEIVSVSLPERERESEKNEDLLKPMCSYFDITVSKVCLKSKIFSQNDSVDII